MSYSRDLPFERGTTWGGGETVAATDAVNLPGKLFIHPDTVNKTGLEVVLRVARNSSGAAITVTQGKVLASKTALTGTEVDGYADAISDKGWIVDDAYPASFSIPANDLFYVVEEGIVQGLSGADWAADDYLAADASGKLVTASAGAQVLAIAREDASAADQLKKVFAIRPSANTPTNGVTDVTASTLAVTKLLHSGRVVTLNRAAGITVTLPAATGSGDVYRFFTGTTVTSNSNIIKVADASDVMAGIAVVAADTAGDVCLAFETASTSDTITGNGSTTGGIKGDFVTLIDVAADLWSVNVQMSATGAEATPFSATV